MIPWLVVAAGPLCLSQILGIWVGSRVQSLRRKVKSKHQSGMQRDEQGKNPDGSVVGLCI